MTDLCRSFAEQIRAKMENRRPQTLIILGSGLGTLAEDIKEKIIIPYTDIDGFPHSTVSGHAGCLISGRLHGSEVLCMQGRFHLYEGHRPQIIAEVIKTFKLLGICNLIVTNAAGSLREEMAPGSLMLIADHINFSGRNPLIGPNDDAFGPRFPDVSNAYDKEFRDRLKNIASRRGISLQEGTYLMVAGPNFETAAEIRAFRTLGADAVGMSTVPEVLAAVWCGMRVLGISVITNYGTGMRPQTQSHAETLSQADAAANSLKLLINDFIGEI